MTTATTTTTTATTATATAAPVHLTTPRTLEVLGSRLELLVEVGHSPGASVVRYVVAPSFTAPPVLHHHVEDDVTMVVLDGALVVDGVEGSVTARAGEVVVLPHGTPFAWRNASATETATYLGIYAPGGFEEYFVEVAAVLADGGAPTPDVVAPLWERFGIAVSEV